MIRKITRFNGAKISEPNLKAWRAATKVGNAICDLAEKLSAGDVMGTSVLSDKLFDIFDSRWIPNKGIGDQSLFDFIDASQKAYRLEQSYLFIERSNQPPHMPPGSINLQLNFYLKGQKVPFWWISVQFINGDSPKDNGKIHGVFLGDYVWYVGHTT
ncbi:MAG TPA: hypothetical protein VL335_03705 [Candidatus Paceibacterota bacterium]|jgi:hypothetical protein|nr:hypothetical protein [Candidatus Paceibacterota bacterium]